MLYFINKIHTTIFHIVIKLIVSFVVEHIY